MVRSSRPSYLQDPQCCWSGPGSGARGRCRLRRQPARQRRMEQQHLGQGCLCPAERFQRQALQKSQRCRLHREDVLTCCEQYLAQDGSSRDWPLPRQALRHEHDRAALAQWTGMKALAACGNAGVSVSLRATRIRMGAPAPPTGTVRLLAAAPPAPPYGVEEAAVPPAGCDWSVSALPPALGSAAAPVGCKTCSRAHW